MSQLRERDLVKLLETEYWYSKARFRCEIVTRRATRSHLINGRQDLELWVSVLLMWTRPILWERILPLHLLDAVVMLLSPHTRILWCCHDGSTQRVIRTGFLPLSCAMVSNFIHMLSLSKSAQLYMDALEMRVSQI